MTPADRQFLQSLGVVPDLIERPPSTPSNAELVREYVRRMDLMETLHDTGQTRLWVPLESIRSAEDEAAANIAYLRAVVGVVVVACICACWFR
jgi:hypothetical protein